MSRRFLTTCVLLAGFGVTAGTAAAAPRLIVTARPGPSATCPTAAELVAAIQERLPGVSAAESGSATGEDLLVSLDARDDGWRCAIARPGGGVVLSRDLGRPKGGCVALADLCTLAVDRLLARIAWPGRDPEIRAGSLTTTAGSGGRAEPGLRARGMLQAWRLGVGPAVRSSVNRGGTGAGAALGVGALAFRRLDLSLSLVATLPDDRVAVVPDSLPGNDPKLTVRTFHAAAAGAASLCSLTWPSACGGVALALQGTRGSVSGRDIYATQGRTILTPSAGLRLALSATFARTFYVSIHALALLPLRAGQLSVEGVAEPAYKTPSFDSFVIVEVGKIL